MNASPIHTGALATGTSDPVTTVMPKRSKEMMAVHSSMERQNKLRSLISVLR